MCLGCPSCPCSWDVQCHLENEFGIKMGYCNLWPSLECQEPVADEGECEGLASTLTIFVGILHIMHNVA